MGLYMIPIRDIWCGRASIRSRLFWGRRGWIEAAALQRECPEYLRADWVLAICYTDDAEQDQDINNTSFVSVSAFVSFETLVSWVESIFSSWQ